MRLLAGAYIREGEIHRGEEEAVKVNSTILLIIVHMKPSVLKQFYCSTGDISVFPISFKVNFFTFRMNRSFAHIESVTL